MRPLTPLRVPAGWLVRYNTLVEFPPNQPLTAEDYRWYHTEDLLQMSSCKLVDGVWQVDREGFLVDLGWYPDGEPNGTYGLIVVRPDFHGETVLDAQHRDQRIICEAIEVCVAAITGGAEIAAIADEVRHIVNR